MRNKFFEAGKGYGTALAAVAIVFLAVVAYLSVQMPSSQSASNGIKKFSSYLELENYLKDSSESYGYYGGGVMRQAVMAESTAAVPAAAASAKSADVSGSSDYSQTNIQVEGVDEADIVKNDGDYIYAVSGNNVVIVDAYPAENAKIVSKIDFNGTIREIFVNKDKLVVFGQKYERMPEPLAESSEKRMVRPDIYPAYSPKTTIGIYDVSDRSSPSPAGGIAIDGDYYDSRMVGEYIYMITNYPAYYAAEKNVTIPRIYSEGKPVSLAFPDVYYFDGVPGNAFTTIASINLENPKEIASKVLLSNYAQNMYVSEKNIYITYIKRMTEADYVDRMVELILPLVPFDVQEKIMAAMALEVSKATKMQAIGEIFGNYLSSMDSGERQSLEEKLREKLDVLENQIAKEREKTIIQKISIDSGNIEYKANGEVPGNTLNQFSMDEHNGYFRIATTTSGNVRAVAMGAAGQRVAAPVQREGPLNHIYVLDSDLKTAGKLEDLASGERIYSVRFLGDKAYMVTFRQIDPLFVIDLSSPEAPKVLGYLKIPGVSDYLHPYDETHVIGIGRDATEEGRITGMKLSLFDVSDVANPKEVSKYIIGERGTDSEALHDHKAFLFSREKSLLSIPVRLSEGGKWNAFQGAYVFSIDPNSGIAFKGKITHENRGSPEKENGYYYEYGSEIRRSLYIDDVLYTISQKMIKMNALGDLSEINKVALQSETGQQPGGIYE